MNEGGSRPDRPHLVSELLASGDFEALRVGRDQEVGACARALTGIQPRNVFVYGERGIGKSFLCRLAVNQMTKQSDQLVQYINTVRLFGQDDSVDLFPLQVLRALCASVWVQVLGHPYSELRERLDSKEPPQLGQAAERKLVHLYRLLMTTGRSATWQSGASIGGAAVLTGNLEQQHTLEASVVPLQPYELLEFARELVTEVLPSRGVSRTTVVLDEANRLRRYEEAELLAKYLEAFGPSGVHFMFVGRDMLLDADAAADCGDSLVLQLEGLSSADEVSELVRNYLGDWADPLDQSAIQVLFDRLCGHPRRTLEVAYSLVGRGAKSFGAREVDHACLAQIEREKRWEDALPPEAG